MRLLVKLIYFKLSSVFLTPCWINMFHQVLSGVLIDDMICLCHTQFTLSEANSLSQTKYPSALVLVLVLELEENRTALELTNVTCKRVEESTLSWNNALPEVRVFVSRLNLFYLGQFLCTSFQVRFSCKMAFRYTFYRTLYVYVSRDKL